MELRKLLIWLRKNLYKNTNKTYLVAFVVLTLSAGAGILMDYFLPFNVWYNILRVFSAVPTSLALFTVFYGASLNLGDKRMKDEDWVPLRERFSYSWRVRISLIIGAFLVLIAYGTQKTLVYTLISAFVLTTIVSLLVFSRKTRIEQIQEEYGLPDSRDRAYAKRLEQLRMEREILTGIEEVRSLARRQKLRGEEVDVTALFDEVNADRKKMLKYLSDNGLEPTDLVADEISGDDEAFLAFFENQAEVDK